MNLNHEIILKLQEAIAGHEVYHVGSDSLAITIPKTIVKRMNIEKGQTYVWVTSDKGILLVPFEKLFRPDNLKQILGFMRMSEYSKEDLELLLREEESTERQ